MSVRSAYHVQPARGWLNDPNGLVFHGGRWHVFYQHNPAAPRHHQIAWGHASSPDLVSWTEHPVAFRPDPAGPDRMGCWSGVAVPVGDRVAAAYTGVVTGPTASTICVRYAGDPLLDAWSPPRVAGTEPAGIGLREMRDPFVFTWGGRRWAVLGAWLADGPGLLLWSCEDLDAWTFERVWLTPDDPVVGALAVADVWECPQLVRVGGSWVLIVSLWQAGILGQVVYAVGSLVDDGGLPRFTARSAGLVDAGAEFYAPQVLQDAPGGGPLLLGWVREPDVPDSGLPGAPQDAGGAAALADDVAGCLTLPRRMGLEGDRLVSEPDPALRSLLGEVVPVGAGLLPTACHVTIGSSAATLEAAGVSVEVPAGSHVWLDGEVLEAYPPDGTPRTYRAPGTSSWRLRRPGEVTVRVVQTVPPATAASSAVP